jgi:SAM-dependent methyltransferase
LRHCGDHVAYYRAVMQDTINHGEARAVDNSDRKHWRKGGKIQFDYLKKHGLKPEDTLLEIGCGNLRAGWRIIEFLDAGHYYGNDISPEVLRNAQDTLVRQGVTDKSPHLEAQFMDDWEELGQRQSKIRVRRPGSA